METPFTHPVRGYHPPGLSRIPPHWGEGDYHPPGLWGIPPPPPFPLGEGYQPPGWSVGRSVTLKGQEMFVQGQGVP